MLGIATAGVATAAGAAAKSARMAKFAESLGSLIGDPNKVRKILAAIDNALPDSSALHRAFNSFDEAGNCDNRLTRLRHGWCFAGETLVHVTALADRESGGGITAHREMLGSAKRIGHELPPGGAAVAELPALAAASGADSCTVAIKDLPLGSRVVADNPRPEDRDDTWPEPEQATWVMLSLDLVKPDGTPVKAEFLRPRAWVERLGIRAGEPLPIVVNELDIDCDAFVRSITPCPEIAPGDGSVVTGRFMVPAVTNVVSVALDNGATILATEVHPVWSVDRDDWVRARDFEPGELVDSLAGPVAVVAVQPLESVIDVYNIEVHGEHVFRVTEGGVLVHNGTAGDPCDGIAQKFRGGKHRDMAFPRGDGLDSHHSPADVISPFHRNDGPAFQMDPRDHRRMSSTGNSKEAKAWRQAQQDLISQGKLREAVQMDIDEARRLFGPKYDDAIREMLDYITSIGY